jgi:hypothetical protein
MICRVEREIPEFSALPMQVGAAAAAVADLEGTHRDRVQPAALAVLEVVVPREERGRSRRTLLREMAPPVQPRETAVRAAAAASIYTTAARLFPRVAEASREAPEVTVVPETAAEAAAAAERAVPV